jgi:hypothetical protein
VAVPVDHLPMTVRHRVFARMWGIAVLAHLAGNWRHGDVLPDPSVIGFLLLAAGLLATSVVVAPRRGALLALAALVPLTVVLEAPVLGNHWLLAGFVSLAYLLAWGRWERFEPAARLILLVFYSFAAFAKINTGFLDPAVSCGVFYANQWLDSYGLPQVGSSSALAWLAAWGSALIELSVPVLLLIRRTRPWGALLAIGFHGFISLDLSQHFYDFTAVLLPLFALFMEDRFFERFETLGIRLRPLFRRVLVGAVIVLGVGVTLANVTPPTELGLRFLQYASFLWWLPYLGAVAWSAVGTLRHVTVSWRLGAVPLVLAALVFLNGLTPYLELKTAYGWNMYSNLVTVDGESNHLIVRSTLPLREGHRNLVRVVSSSDPGLEIYTTNGYLLPWPSFRSYLASRPDISVTYERAGIRVEVPTVGESGLGEPVPWWWRWFPLRAVHEENPATCQPVFLPAL